MFSSKKRSFLVFFVVNHLAEVFFDSRVQFIPYKNMNLLFFCQTFFIKVEDVFGGFPRK